MIGAMAGGAYGGGLIILGRIKRQDPIPFGPFLSAGALVDFFHLFRFETWFQ
jgi:leader peptidase (prepilin peptidase)/N-methyltransferase